MKYDNALPGTAIFKRDARPCYLAHVRSLLNAIRVRHRLNEPVRGIDETVDDSDEQEGLAPTLHDLHVSELEAAVHSPSTYTRIAVDSPIDHDSPAELARARRVFAATWLIPLLAVSMVLALFGNSLDRSLFELLQFSTLTLAIPLAGSGGALLYRTLKRGLS